MNFKNSSKINEYIVLKENEHNKSFDRTGSGEKTHVYEHHVIAEEMLNRELRNNEEVHHLDKNRSNNSPDNLLVLDKDQHVKLHSWLDKNIIIPKPSYAIRTLKGCIRCDYCNKPIAPDKKRFCNNSCRDSFNKIKLSKETPVESIKELLNSNLSMTKIGKILGLSDNGVKARCKALNIDINRK
jgi:transposase-like protein